MIHLLTVKHSKDQHKHYEETLFYLAVMGWVFALVIHIFSITGFDLGGTSPWFWILSLGVVVVWFPAVFDLKKNEALKAYQQSGMLKQLNPLAFFKIIFERTPLWLTVIAVCGFFYAIINFVLFFLSSQHATPDLKDGQYILHNHGQLIKTITEQEYHQYKAKELRGFSGHWIAFYGIAAAILFPFSGNDNSED